MAGLDMQGFVDPVFKSVEAVRTSYSDGDYVNGIWVDGGSPVDTSHDCTIQQASDREIDTLEKGGDRVLDARRIWVNDSAIALAKISQADLWTFEGQTWKCYKIDNRPWRTYCRLVVARFDVQL